MLFMELFYYKALKIQAKIVIILTKRRCLMKDKKCQLEVAACPVCGGDINFKKRDKAYCNCKKCDWRCEGKCEA